MDNPPCGCNIKCFEVVAKPQRNSLKDSVKLVISMSISGCIKVVEVAKRYSERGGESWLIQEFMM